MKSSVVVIITALAIGSIASPVSVADGPSTIDERASKICKRQYESGYFPRALKNCSKAAESGDARSYLILGLMYRAGISTMGVGNVEYPELAYKSFLKAAKLGNAQAHYFVGVMLMNGEGVTRDEEEGEWWIQKAAEMGYSPN